MSRIGVGRTIDGGGASKPVTKTKAQVEREEAQKAAAAAAAKAAAIASEARRDAVMATRAPASFVPSTPTTLPTTTRVTTPTAPASTPITAAPVAATPTPISVPPAPTPPAPQEQITATPVPAVRSAPIDTVEFIDERFSDELIIDLLFEDVGGQELLTIARNDTVNGQDVVYQPFKNLGILQETYNPTTLLRLQQTSDKFFSNFTINLRDKIPNVGSGENGKNYKLDLATGEGVIEFINIRPDEQVEVQILSAGIIEDIDLTESTES